MIVLRALRAHARGCDGLALSRDFPPLILGNGRIRPDVSRLIGCHCSATPVLPSHVSSSLAKAPHRSCRFHTALVWKL